MAWVRVFFANRVSSAWLRAKEGSPRGCLVDISTPNSVESSLPHLIQAWVYPVSLLYLCKARVVVVIVVVVVASGWPRFGRLASFVERATAGRPRGIGQAG
eukprot:COSAG05_NODE_376_length_10629_cov_43.288319_6_plen_101_part_00